MKVFLGFMGKVKAIAAGRSVRSVAKLAMAAAGGQLVLLLASPLLTRLYRPDEFGVLAVFSSLLGLLVVASSLRYELAIPLPKLKRNAETLLWGALGINALFSVFLFILVFLWRAPVADSIGLEEEGYLWFLPVAVFLMGRYRTFNFWALRNKDYSRLARSKFSQNIGNVVVQVSAGLAGLGAAGLLAGMVVGQAAGVGLLIRGLTAGSFSFKRDWPRVRYLLKKHSRFPKYDAPAAFLNTLSSELPQLLFAVLFSPAVAGFFLLANRVLAMPLSLVGQAVGQVLYSEARDAIGAGSLGKVVEKVVLALLGFVLVPSLIVFLFGEDIFAITFGEDWRHAGQFAAILMLSIAAQFAYAPISLMLLATGGQYINLWISLMMVTLRGAGIFLGWLEEDALLALWGFSIGGFIAYVLGILTVVVRTRRYRSA